MKSKIILILILCNFPLWLSAQTRIDDITSVHGIDENLLQGVGIVVGLNGKGDKGLAIKKLAQKILNRMGSEFDEKDLEAKNMAIVHVTAILPPFARPGQKIDVTVAAQGAKSLEGGILIACHLYISGVDPSKSKPAVLAQGPILVGNTGQVGRQKTGGGSGASIPTVGKAVGAGTLLREVEQHYLNVSTDKKGNPVSKWIQLVLSKPNFTNANEISKAINSHFARELVNPDSSVTEVQIARAISAGEVMVTIPKQRWSNIIGFISIVQRLRLNHIESEALVVVNEKTGGIALSGDVKLNACTVAYNQVIINIVKDQDLSQVLQQLSAVLMTKDQIEIIKTLHAAGHLRAELKVE
jgi:flagellar P-ring protein precursor FlgI